VKWRALSLAGFFFFSFSILISNGLINIHIISQNCKCWTFFFKTLPQIRQQLFEKYVFHYIMHLHRLAQYEKEVVSLRSDRKLLKKHCKELMEQKGSVDQALVTLRKLIHTTPELAESTDPSTEQVCVLLIFMANRAWGYNFLSFTVLLISYES
jgi:hypothetical protein